MSAPTEQRYRTTSGQTSLRSGPGSEHGVVTKLPQATGATLLGGPDKEGWSQVTAEVGGEKRVGHVHSTFLKPEPREGTLPNDVPKSRSAGSDDRSEGQWGPSARNRDPLPTDEQPLPSVTSEAQVGHRKAGADFAFVIGRIEFEGAHVFPKAQEMVLAVQKWLMSAKGPALPSARIFPPPEQDFTRSDAQQLETQLFNLLAAVMGDPTLRRLFIYAAGPVFSDADTNSEFLLCAEGDGENSSGFHLDRLAEWIALTGLFPEVILLVDGVEVNYRSDDLRHTGPVARAVGRMPMTGRPPGRVFRCIGLTPSPRTTGTDKAVHSSAEAQSTHTAPPPNRERRGPEK